MRDPKRIPAFLTLLQIYWEKVPDWRFGQLIENLKSFSGKTDLFYLEDDDFKKILKDYFELNK
jgi:uncharacterized protein YihD (DUF1040 family)